MKKIRNNFICLPIPLAVLQGCCPIKFSLFSFSHLFAVIFKVHLLFRHVTCAFVKSGCLGSVCVCVWGGGSTSLILSPQLDSEYWYLKLHIKIRVYNNWLTATLQTVSCNSCDNWIELMRSKMKGSMYLNYDFISKWKLSITQYQFAAYLGLKFSFKF